MIHNFCDGMLRKHFFQSFSAGSAVWNKCFLCYANRIEWTHILNWSHCEVQLYITLILLIRLNDFSINCFFPKYIIQLLSLDVLQVQWALDKLWKNDGFFIYSTDFYCVHFVSLCPYRSVKNCSRSSLWWYFSWI